MELTDAQGKTIWEADYGSFGRARVDAGSRIKNHIRFPSQYHDEETGLHYNRYRYYEPETGRYLSKDPIGLERGKNQFGYVDGNPLSFVYPTGEIAIAPVIVWGLPIVDGIVWGLTKKPRWPPWGGGDENTGGEPCPKKNKEACIRTYAN